MQILASILCVYQGCLLFQSAASCPTFVLNSRFSKFCYLPFENIEKQTQEGPG